MMGVSDLHRRKGWFQRKALCWGEEEKQATKLEIIPNWFLLLKK